MNAPQDKTVSLTDRFGLAKEPVPAEPMISPAYFEREKEKIFRKTWLNMLRRGAEIPHPGDFFIRDIEMFGASVIVVRGDDGRIRAFHNSCTHRGNKLVHSDGKAACDSAKGFGCGFHGWTFNNQGELVYVPDEEQFFDLDKKTLGLSEIRCDTWRDIIFINFDATPRTPLAVAMASFDDRLKEFPFEEMTCVARYRVRGKANWKVTLNAFQEGYHLPYVHALSFPDAFSGADNPFCHIQYLECHDNGNQKMGAPGAPDHKPTPAEALAFRLASSTFAQGAMGDNRFPGTNPGNLESWGFDVNLIFPFSRVNVGAGWYYSDAFWPITHDETLYELAFYFPKPANAGQMIGQEYSKALLRDSAREDLSTNEATQASLSAGAIKQVHFSDQEVACRHLYRVVDNLVNS